MQKRGCTFSHKSCIDRMTRSCGIVECGEDGGQGEAVPELCEVIGDHFRRTDDSPAPPRLVRRDRLELVKAEWFKRYRESQLQKRYDRIVQGR